MSATRVTPETISSAVSALLKWKESKSSSEKAQLLPQEEFFYLTLTLKHIPQKGCRVNPYKIPLPHPLVQDSEICLIIDDRPKSKMTSKEAKKKVQNDGILVSKVLKFTKLKTDYKAFEAKRKLCDSYDMFFAAKGVIPLLPKLLGKSFFKKKKLPLPIDLSHKNWKEQIERACGSGLFYIKSGTCSVVKIGRVSMEEREVVENVVEGINGVVELVPKGWEGVRSFHLKLSGSLGLPLYQAVPDVKLKIEGLREVVEEGMEGVVEGSEGKKKDGKVGKSKKKKGRIHEVKYMDVSGEDEVASDVDEGEKESEEVKVESELVGKKRKKGGSVKGKARGEKVSEETDDKEDLEIKKVEVTKKKKKADAEGQVTADKIVEKSAKKMNTKADAKGQVTIDKSVEKPAKKIKKKAGADVEEKIDLPVLKEESAEKKGKKKSGLATTVKKAKIVKKK
ncbi:putative ribosome biogenesis protein C8F11.04 [Apium graveolens]|uniref:putative ribosome biogenesis protein C8F11.04 n=1 Tax=Apium graveolens TaxID=4045 RepID=UPI003D7B8528